MYRVCVRHVKIVGTVTGGYDTISVAGRTSQPIDGDETATFTTGRRRTFLG